MIQLVICYYVEIQSIKKLTEEYSGLTSSRDHKNMYFTNAVRSFGFKVATEWHHSLSYSYALLCLLCIHLRSSITKYITVDHVYSQSLPYGL